MRNMTANILANKSSGISDSKARVYRQALRDVPEQAGFPFDVQWPEV